uniref:Vacuolar protein-sorting-associated protein 25 n=1 Tax=Gallus gallus TaxID=9031 RepID=A0A8V0ZH54_CHICK
MSFSWPWQYSFPPFFTLQPNGETRQKQLAAWCALALAYSRRQRLPAMTLREAQDSPLFANRRLQSILWARSGPLRSPLPPSLVGCLLNQLSREAAARGHPGGAGGAAQEREPGVVRQEQNQFSDNVEKTRGMGKAHLSVSKNGLTNSVFTLYELISGDDTANEEFHGLDEAMLLRALQALQQEHKAEIITLDDGRGVKFF